MTYTRSGASVTVALALTTALSSQALAQDRSGLGATLSFDQRLEYSDNPDLVVDPEEGALLARTSLGFALNSETRTQSLRLTLGTLLEGRLTGQQDVNDSFEVVRDTASLRYFREASSARLSLGASYVNTDRDDFEIELDFLPDALIIDDGEVRTFRADANLENDFGRIGTDLRLGYRNTEYTGVVDPDLEDSETVEVDGTVSFTINPALTARALAGWSQTVEEDIFDTTRTSTYVGAGLVAETAAGLTVSGDLTFDENETETIFGTGDDSGVGFNLAVTQDRPNGSLGARVSSRVDTDGRLTRASVNRNLDLRDGGALSLSVGVIAPDDDDARPVAQLSYATETPRGELSATLSQTPVSDDGDTVLNTALRLNYGQAINAVTSWSAGLSYSAANVLGDGDDSSRTEATVSYNYDLTEDWDLRAGYNFTRRDQDGADERTENSIFLSVERDFSFGF